MHFEGSTKIKAPQKIVWEFLTNPEAVAECVPGLQSVEVIEPDRKFRAVALVKLGTVRLPFTTIVEWLELNAPNQAIMRSHGETSGSVVDIDSQVTLTTDADGGTNLEWSAEVMVVGAIASMASRLMNVTTKSLGDHFFACTKAKLEV